MMAAYLQFLSDSLTGIKRGAAMTSCCEINAAIDRLGGDEELYKDLVERFINDTAGTRARLESALDLGDAAHLHAAAHSLKGLAASVGATTVAAALTDLEQLGREGNLDAAPAAWQRFRSEMERSAEELSLHHRKAPSIKNASAPAQ